MRWLILGLVVACATPPAKLKGDDVIEIIQETTVGDLNGTSTPMANMGQDEYELPDGTRKTGMTATLYPGESGFHRVGVGSVVEIGGVRWEVIDVSKPEGQPLGTVSLRQEGTGGGAALDFEYRRECSSCGEWAGWTGRVEKESFLGRTDHQMVFRCPRCREDYPISIGTYQAELRAGTLPFVPGRGAG
jgi:hypothetical protein